MQTPIEPGHSGPVVWVRVIAVGVALASLSMFSRVLERTLHSGLGLLALGVLMGIGWAVLRALPALGQWCEKQILRAQLGEARSNPIDELQHQLVERAAQLERYRDALSSIAVQIGGLREMVDARRAASPQQDVSRQAAALEKMQAFYALHLTRLQAAEHALIEYHQHLNAKRFEWEFAQAGETVLAGLRASGRDGIARELMRDEATRAVQAKFTRVFAALDADLVSVKALKITEGGAP